MDYQLSKSKRNNIILCSVFLILYYTISGLSSFLESFRKFDAIEIGFSIVLFTITFSYIYLIFIEYFRNYNLKVLSLISWVLLISEIGNQVYSLINLYRTILPDLISDISRVISIISMIIWTVLLVRIKSDNYRTCNPLKRYALGQIFAVLMGVGISVFLMFGEHYDYMDMMVLPLIIPYIFIIEFAIKSNQDQLKPTVSPN